MRTKKKFTSDKVRSEQISVITVVIICTQVEYTNVYKGLVNIFSRFRPYWQGRGGTAFDELFLSWMKPSVAIFSSGTTCLMWISKYWFYNEVHITIQFFSTFYETKDVSFEMMNQIK